MRNRPTTDNALAQKKLFQDVRFRESYFELRTLQLADHDCNCRHFGASVGDLWVASGINLLAQTSRPFLKLLPKTFVSQVPFQTTAEGNVIFVFSPPPQHEFISQPLTSRRPRPSSRIQPCHSRAQNDWFFLRLTRSH